MLSAADIRTIARMIAKYLDEYNDQLLTLEEAAKKIGKSPEAVRKLCQRDRLPHHRHHGTLYFSMREIQRFLLDKIEINKQSTEDNVRQVRHTRN